MYTNINLSFYVYIFGSVDTKHNLKTTQNADIPCNSRVAMYVQCCHFTFELTMLTSQPNKGHAKYQQLIYPKYSNKLQI